MQGDQRTSMSVLEPQEAQRHRASAQADRDAVQSLQTQMKRDCACWEEC